MVSRGLQQNHDTAKMDKCVKTRPKICQEAVLAIKAHVSRFAVQKQVENAVDPPAASLVGRDHTDTIEGVIEIGTSW